VLARLGNEVVNVALKGRLIRAGTVSTLLIDAVDTRKLLTDLANEKGGEVTIKAKLVEQAGGKTRLVSAGRSHSVR
jgi:hypothetical protein